MFNLVLKMISIHFSIFFYQFFFEVPANIFYNFSKQVKLGILKEYEQGIFSKYVVNSDGYLFSTKFFSPFGEIKITKSKKEISIKYLEIG